MAKTITLKEAPATYVAAIEQVTATGETVIVEKDGQPSVVLVPFDEYQHLIASRERQRKEEYRRAFEEERDAFYRLKPQLLQTHRDHYVAIRGGQVVDSDADDSKLAQRVMTQFAGQAVYVQLVSEALPAFELASPEEPTRA